MVQLSTLFSALSKNIVSAGKKSRAAHANELVLTSCDPINNSCDKNFSCGYSKRGKKGINNQDRFIVWEEFGCEEDMTFCGVFDGHGLWGHLVAKAVRESLPSALFCNWQETVAHNNYMDDQLEMWKQSYYKTCAAVDRQLQHHPRIDSFYSGTTALSLVRQGDLMIVANVGDSRAVLATTSDDGTLIATQLSTDLKPNLPYESKRIAQSRGRVYSCPDEVGVHRLWMPNGETVQGPGLAVSRAFGDYYIKDFGLISEPEIRHTSISSRDQFAILATDGVWDVISNEEAVDIVGSVGQLQRAESAKRLVESAACEWKRKGRGAVMDDISAVCLFFHRSTIAVDHHQEQDNEN